MQFGARTLEEWARSLHPTEATKAEVRPDAPVFIPNQKSSLAYAKTLQSDGRPSETNSGYAANSGQYKLNLTTSTHSTSTNEKLIPAAAPKLSHPTSSTVSASHSINLSSVQHSSNSAAHPPSSDGVTGLVSAVNGDSATAKTPKRMSWAERVALNTPGHVTKSNEKESTNKTAPPPVQPKRPAPLPPLPPRRVRGLINAGNTCFINVCLQALISCDPFRRYLLSLRGNHSNPPLVSKFVELAVEMSVVDGREEPPFSTSFQAKRSKSPQALSKHIPNLSEPILPDWSHSIFEGSAPIASSSDQTQANGAQSGGRHTGTQEDAEEFLMCVLNKLHDELIAASKDKQQEGSIANGFDGDVPFSASRSERTSSPSQAIGGTIENGNGEWHEINRRGRPVHVRESHTTHSPITKLFGGQLRHELRKAHAQTANKEPFLSLQLGIESGMIRGVKDALIEVFRVEHLQSDLESKHQSNMRKQILLDSLPQVLILHIKRFTSNIHTQAVSKVSRRLEFPENLTIPSSIFYSPMLPTPNERNYRLSAVVTHIGKEMAGGHYVVDVRVQEGGKDFWVTCDDSKVIQANLQGVLRRQAYLLLYTRVLDGT